MPITIINQYLESGGGGGCASIQGITQNVPTTPGTSNISYYPMFGLYNYNNTVALIQGSTIGSIGESQIEKISIQLSSWSGSFSKTNQTIWLAHCTDTAIPSSQTFNGYKASSSISDLTEVKTNFTFAPGGSGWYDISLDNNFCYVGDGSTSIAIFWEDASGQWSSGYGWTEGYSSNRSVAVAYNDYSQPNTNSWNVRLARRINIKLHY